MIPNRFACNHVSQNWPVLAMVAVIAVAAAFCMIWVWRQLSED